MKINNNAKLTEYQVQLIRYLYDRGNHPRAIARFLKIPYGTVYDVATRRSWQNVEEIEE